MALKDVGSPGGIAVLRESVKLPCGRVVPNRLAKVAMYEALTSFGGGPPNDHHFRLYEAWSKGGWGMITTGNVFVDPQYQALGQDLIVPSRSKRDAYDRLAKYIKGKTAGPSAPLAIVQLNHAGRQSMRCNFRPPWTPAIAPSAIPMDSGEGWLAELAYLTFYGYPREMTRADIDKVVLQFRDAAVMAYETGWDGVQIHCAHGYLLSTFLSPRSNHRTDAYGGTPQRRLKIVLDIITAVRAAVPPSFCVGVKVNSRDFVKGGLTEAEALQHIQIIHEHGGIDYIEISGGSYEAAGFMEPGDPSVKPFFERFAASATSMLSSNSDAPLIMLTGNVRSRRQCIDIVQNDTAQLCGMARPAAIDPNFAAKLLDERLSDAEATAPPYDVKGGVLIKALRVKIVGGGVESLWHNFMLARIARGKRIDIHKGFWPLVARHILASRDFWAFFAFIIALEMLGRPALRRHGSIEDI